MNENDFVELNKHLKELEPIFIEFCSQNEFVFTNKKSLGRYPRIRIERQTEINIWFDLWMQPDKSGNRFEIFNKNLPYELSAGAYYTESNNSKTSLRFDKSFICFSDIPFFKIEIILQAELSKNLITLKQWNVDFLKKFGRKVVLQ